MNNTKKPATYLRKAAITVEILRERLRASLALPLGPRAAAFVERTLWWLMLISMSIATVLAVLEGLAAGAPARQPVITLTAAELVHYGIRDPRESKVGFVDRMIAYDAVMAQASGRVGDHGFSPRVNHALLITLGSFESRFSRRVCENFKHAATGNPAVSCWQTEVDDPQTVAQAARMAVVSLDKARRYCQVRGHDPIEGALSLYATGKTCTWPEASKRAARFRAVYWRIGR